MKTRKSKRVNEESRLREIEVRLRAQYGQPRHHNPEDPLDDLVFVALSRMTQEVKYRRTYEALREAMPTWGAVRDAPDSELRDLLTDAGLAATKASHLKALLAEVGRREGGLDLRRLAALSDEEIETYLTSLPGVGRKTARCVMLYAFDRAVCPVDTHVWRVMQRLGFAPAGARTERRSQALEDRIPPPLRASLHVTLIAHGREVCRAPIPRCASCSLADLCSYARRRRRGRRLRTGDRAPARSSDASGPPSRRLDRRAAPRSVDGEGDPASRRSDIPISP